MNDISDIDNQKNKKTSQGKKVSANSEDFSNL